MAEAEHYDDAIALLREGIYWVPADKNVFSLYQSCAELLGREGKTEEAIKLLRGGIAKVPAEFGRHKLIEGALYLSAAARRQNWLEDLLIGQIGTALSAAQKALGRSLLQQLTGDWEGAATEASSGISTLLTYLPLYVQEAFCRLCARQPDRAQAALDRLPHALEHRKGAPYTWLACFIALRRNDVDAVRQLYASSSTVRRNWPPCRPRRISFAFGTVPWLFRRRIRLTTTQRSLLP